MGEQIEMTLEDKYWLELLQAVIEGKMSDAEANQSWYEYINERKDMRGMINENLIQERMNQLRETEMFKFIEDIPKDNLWKIAFAVSYLFNDEDVRGRAKGEWIVDDLGTTVCSKCKRPRRDNRVGHLNFCNSCGADMRGEA